ncbi:MAG: hypothetical protein KGH63_02105, partial [Candidatus Micrarchaeota archaeon]|nr:hypothetical protein [Candidatus Micrarchaeota archaeon]
MHARLLSSAFFILLLAVCVSAQLPGNSSLTPPAADLSSAVSQLLLPNETSSLSPAPLSNGQWGYLVYVNGSAAGFIIASPSLLGGYDVRLLTDPAELRTTLSKYYQQADARSTAGRLLDQAHAQMLLFNRSRTLLRLGYDNPPGQVGGEDACRKLLGILDHPCSDYDTCLKACFASTSFCQPMAVNLGPSFINQMGAYQNGTENLTAAFAGQETAYQAASSDLSAARISDYRRSIQFVINAEAALAAHPFNGWLCALPHYDNESVDTAQKDLDLANEYLLPTAGRGTMADLLANATAARLLAHQQAQQNQNQNSPGAGGPAPGIGSMLS